MFSRIERYLARELATTFAAILTIFTLVMVANVLARLLVRVAEGRLAADTLLVLMGLHLVKAMTVLVPFSAFIALMLMLGRFYRDSEMAALMACGIGPAKVYRGLLVFMLPLFLALAWIVLYGAPRAAALRDDLTRRAEQIAAISFVVPGQFRELGDGRVVAYTESVNAESGELVGIFIRVLDNDVPDVISAERGRLYRDPKTRARYVLLENGNRYQGEPGTLEFRITQFQRFAVLIEEPDEPSENRRRSQLPTAELLGSVDSEDQAELQWRIAVPFALVVLLTLAVPLAHVQPREGRYGRLAYAILIFVVYMNLMSMGKSWIEKGTLPAIIGLWWVHLIFLCYALWVLARLRWLNLGNALDAGADP